MTKLTLTYVDRKERQGAKGPFTSLSIKTTEYGDRFISGFGRKDNESWKVGDSVEVEAVREVVKDGKTYLNFDMPKSERASGSADLTEIKHLLNQMATTLGATKAKVDFIERCLGFDQHTSDGAPGPKF